MQPVRRSKGFRRTSALVDQKVRAVTGARGFSESRLLTHWEEIVGADTAEICRPVDVKYIKAGFGATLTLLTTGTQAPILKMQEPRIRERVNACYGYNAIARIRITQTAPTGFAEGRVQFQSKTVERPTPNPRATAQAVKTAASVGDPALRAALEQLGAHIISKKTR